MSILFGVYFSTILFFPLFKLNAKRESFNAIVFIFLLLTYTFHPLSYGIDVYINVFSSKSILATILFSLNSVIFTSFSLIRYT